MAIHTHPNVLFGAQAALFLSHFHPTALWFCTPLPRADTQCEDNGATPIGAEEDHFILQGNDASPHIPGANACGRHVNRWNTMYHCWMMLFVHSWQHSLQKRFFEEFVAYKKLHQRSLPGIASFLRKTFTHLRQRAWSSFVCIMKAWYHCVPLTTFTFFPRSNHN